MRSSTKRHRRLTAACALISALALGGVYAGQSVAAGSPSSSSSSPDGDSSSDGGSSSPEPPKDDDSTDWERQDKASRAYTECMRDNGLEDFDIVIYTADGGRGVKVRIDRGEGDGAKRPDPTSKEFRKAAKACQDILDDIGVKLPVPPGDLPGRGDGPFPAPGGCGEIRQHEKGGDEKGNSDRREDGDEDGDTESSTEGLVLSG
ncbi:hypothetical protein C6Y14_39650 [Streptomyces dioscori]|uniref:Secreted protein n=1 Tax=Streptomyces dioscori TaxID=2109333 RepID=A0A2P8PVB9_9ACTN|nr:hypothetical protein [Streptomyces dioscori]PSM37938.1 hypothetical protein C6Y14_39650 [Streptomyces dioscori]